MEDGDSIEHHIKDTLKSGMGLAEEEAVRIFCEQASQVTRGLHRRFNIVYHFTKQNLPALHYIFRRKNGRA